MVGDTVETALGLVVGVALEILGRILLLPLRDLVGDLTLFLTIMVLE